MLVFREDLPWYRGNLHTHTTMSDGDLGPEAAIAAYKKAGYDFLALTDHWHYREGLEEEGFTLLSGVEYDDNDFAAHKAWHIIGVGMEKPPQTTQGEPAQQLSRAVVQAGGLAILGHPWWSLLSPEDMIGLADVFATEVYSGISYAFTERGDSSQFVDICAARGCYRQLLGVDDVHRYGRDLFYGYIMLQAPSRTREDLLRALAAGSFYATTGGPAFRQIEVDGGRVHISCEPAQTVAIHTNSFSGEGRVHRAEGVPLTQVTYKLQRTDDHVRVQLTGADGRLSTSQFIRV